MKIIIKTFLIIIMSILSAILLLYALVNSGNIMFQIGQATTPEKLQKTIKLKSNHYINVINKRYYKWQDDGVPFKSAYYIVLMPENKKLYKFIYDAAYSDAKEPFCGGPKISVTKDYLTVSFEDKVFKNKIKNLAVKPETHNCDLDTWQ